MKPSWERNLARSGPDICGVESMRQMNEKFNEETSIDTLSFMADDQLLDELPDFTTLNNYLEKLSPDCHTGRLYWMGRGCSTLGKSIVIIAW